MSELKVKWYPSQNEYLNVQEDSGQCKSLKALNLHRHEDGWLYFDTEDENGVIQHYKVKPNE